MNTPSRRINPEWVVAISAVIISLCALGVSIFQTRIMKQQQAHSVWPHLQVYNSNLNGLELTLENKGVGPALVNEVEYSFDGKTTHKINELIEMIFAADGTVSPDSTINFRYSHIENLVLAPNDSHLLLDIKYPEAKIVNRAFDKIGFRLCYCSIEEECWHITGLLTRPKPGCE